ncbi:MAG: sensor histidine kinase [Lachnospiraceae bacterium]
MIKKEKFYSIVAKKITRKMLFIYLCIYVFILLLLSLILAPYLYKIADTKASETLSIMADELSETQNSLMNYTNTLYSSPILKQYIEEYANTPSSSKKAKIEQELSSFVSSNSQLLGISLEDDEHTFFVSTLFRNVLTPDLMANNEHYLNLFEYSNGSYFNYLSPEVFHTDKRSSSTETSYHAFIYSKIVYYDQKPYVVSLFYNANSSFDHCQTLANELFTSFAIIDRYQELLYTTDSQNIRYYQELSKENTLIKSVGKMRTISGNYYYHMNPTTGWTYITYSPYQLLLENLIIIILIITLLYIISPVLYALFLMPTTTKTLAPLAQLSLAMQDYKVGDSIELEIHTGDEIEFLSKIYCEMTAKINLQIDDIRKQEHMNSIVNYKLLATQLDPHFIYNTMNIINIMARQGNTDAIVEINSALIKILRERLNTKLSISDAVANELETLSQYQLIMDYRYQNQIKTQIEVDEALLAALIPKNILQPLVENAYYHAFGSNTLKDDAFINIMIYSIDDHLIIEVSDNGDGIDEERLKMLSNRSYDIYRDNKPHIGLDNIQQRLEYIYKGDYQFNIQSSIGFGTTISISIPQKDSMD